MKPFLLVLLTILFIEFVSSSKENAIDFQLGPNETMIKEMDLEAGRLDISSSRFAILTLQTSSPISLKLSGGGDGCSEEILLENSGSVEIEVAEDTWRRIKECKELSEKIQFQISTNEDEGAMGTISLYMAQSVNLKLKAEAEAIVSHGVVMEQDSNRFTVAENSPFFRKIKLKSLQDNVEIRLTSENVENALEVQVYISFCPTQKGILYTTSYSPNLDITLKSPRMELYYDSYSCDSNITFYSNSSQPVSPLIIRLESNYTINGTITVLINGAEPSLESHVAEYETGTYQMESGQEQTFELKHEPNVENVKVYLDVVSGSLSAWISPCRTSLLDTYYDDLDVKAHQIDINVDNLMANSTCALPDIDARTVFLTIKSHSTTTFILWTPAEKATWHLAILLGVVLVILGVIMALIIYFGRRKTGKLTINYFN